jgi:hypothetical protein
MSQIPKININTIMKLTVANFLQIYITWRKISVEINL